MLALAPPGRRPGAGGRARLVRVARMLFAERGFQMVSTKELATEAGVTIGALYHHFDSKAAMYRAALDDAVAELRVAPTDAVLSMAPRPALELLIAWFSETLIGEPMLRQELLDPHLAVPLTSLPFFASPNAAFERLMRQVAPGFDTRIAMAAIVSLCFGLTSLKGLPYRDAVAAEMSGLARRIADLILGGSPG